LTRKQSVLIKLTLTSNLPTAMTPYTDSVNLSSEMYEFGTYRLTYEPPQGALESTIDMSISAEADLEQVTEFFASFLRAAGYPIEYSEVLEVADASEEKEEEVAKPRDSWGDDWGDDGFSLVGNPWESLIPGAYSEDTLYFSSASTTSGFPGGFSW
jgi:hypothetical protein